MFKRTYSDGKVHISPQAVARVAREAALQSYGVVGMADKNRAHAWARRLGVESSDAQGVRVRVRDGRLIVDLYVIVQYGTRISEVAQGVMSQVKYALEQTLGIPVAEINVHVQGLRLNHEPEESGGAKA